MYVQGLQPVVLCSMLNCRSKRRQTGMQQTSAISDADRVRQHSCFDMFTGVVIDYCSNATITGR